jgi:hypothetical protein
MIDERKSGLILLGIVFVAVAFMMLSAKMLDGQSTNFAWLLVFVGYIGFVLLLVIVKEKLQCKAIDLLIRIVFFPLSVVGAILSVLTPSITIFFYLILMIVFSAFVPAMVLTLLDVTGVYHCSENQKIYLLVNFISIGVLLFYKQFIRIFSYVELGHASSSTSEDKKALREFVIYVITESNVRFLIYSVFFLFLITFSWDALSMNPITNSDNTDYAILQAFLTFLALDRVLLYSKNVTFRATDALNKMLDTVLIKKDNGEQ